MSAVCDIINYLADFRCPQKRAWLHRQIPLPFGCQVAKIPLPNADV
jgi:hypothetical protein